MIDVLLGFQIIFGVAFACIGLHLAKEAVEAINNARNVSAGIVGLFICSIGVLGGCLLALIGVFALIL